MKARVLFGVFGFIFVLLALYVFPPIVLEAVVAALCVIATCEVLGSTKLVHNRLELLLAMLVSLGLAVGHFTVLPLDLTDVMQDLVLVMLVGSFAIELKFHDSMKVSQVAWGFFGALLVPYLLLSLLRIFQMNYHHGPFIVLLPLLAAWVADTCALFAGMFFGRHKLAPVVSPKKTVEGAVGGVIGGAVLVLIAALIMNKTVFRGKPVPFVMELPNYRMPGLKSVALLLWEKAKDFLQRAFTVIFLATIIIWFLQSFDTRLNVVADSAASLLALIGRWIAPIFRPLGFGDWRCATALISGFIAKESVVSTLQVLLGGAAISSLLSTRAAVSFLVFTLLYTPCVAAVATIRRELDSRLKTVGVVLLQCTVAWIVAFVAYAIAGLV